MYIKPTNRQFAAIFDTVASRYDKILNRYSLSRRVEFIRRYAKGHCLEVGAGSGVISQTLAKNHRVVATDISPQMVKVIKRKNIEAHISDAENLPFLNASFDTVVSTEMIYYLDRPEKFLSEARRVLKPGGRIILTASAKITEGYDRLRSWLRSLGFTSMYFDDQNRRFMNGKKLKNLLTQAGFTIKQMDRAILFPWASFDSINRLLETTPLKHLCIFHFVYAEKSKAKQ